ncbi:MAG: protein kinase [Ktedonobacteraceae bacterium]|nr:protein kinase [Ktedonobacteraceae bacterium]
MMSLPIALRPGTVVGGHYIIGSLINSGGFGAVYRGVDTSEGNRPCAIKETYDVTPASRRQALMEASVLFTVRSQHLPEVYDTFEANGRFYLIMQLIEGQNLLQLLRSRVPGGIVGEREPHQQGVGPCSEQEVLTWLLPIMDILQELHSRRPPVMHRDIKPGNIILTPHQTAVLVDFGLTRLYDPTRNTQTMTRAVTEGFSPLEQYVGKTSPQSDIYALAATMYLLLTNRMPPAATRRSMHDELIAPRLLNPSLTLEIERVLLQALSLHAQDRYKSMREFAEALQDRGFSSHSDPTLSVNPQRTGNPPSLVLPSHPTPTYPAAPMPTYAGGYASVQSPTQPAPVPVPQIQVPMPKKGRKLPPGGTTPQYQQPVYAQPGGYVAPAPGTPYRQGQTMMPQAMAPQSMRALPNPSNQGCLWGIVQGVLAGLLVLFMREAIYFELATVMGFSFYILAGFITTRRGGATLRGAWAGYWAGITSTGMFWFVLGVGLLIRVSQYMQTYSSNGGSSVFRDMLNNAWQTVMPHVPDYMFVTSQPGWVNVLILLIVGLITAFALGGVGGILGRMNNQSRTVKP